MVVVGELRGGGGWRGTRRDVRVVVVVGFVAIGMLRMVLVTMMVMVRVIRQKDRSAHAVRHAE